MFFGSYELFPKPHVFDEVVLDPPRNCAICLEDIGTGSRLKNCKHVYHTECIREWFKKKQNCPVCRCE